MNIYYVYFYLRSKNSKTEKIGTPYYVGKGKGPRAFKSHGNIPVPKDKSKIIMVHENISEMYALYLERYYIRWYGRKDKGSGILLNMTDGGEGCGGRIISNNHRLKNSQIQKERSVNGTHQFKTKNHSENTRNRQLSKIEKGTHIFTSDFAKTLSKTKNERNVVLVIRKYKNKFKLKFESRNWWRKDNEYLEELLKRLEKDYGVI